MYQSWFTKISHFLRYPPLSLTERACWSAWAIIQLRRSYYMYTWWYVNKRYWVQKTMKSLLNLDIVSVFYKFKPNHSLAKKVKVFYGVIEILLKKKLWVFFPKSIQKRNLNKVIKLFSIFSVPSSTWLEHVQNRDYPKKLKISPKKNPQKRVGCHWRKHTVFVIVLFVETKTVADVLLYVKGFCPFTVYRGQTWFEIFKS